MSSDAIAGSDPFAVLRRFARSKVQVEQCELCRTVLAPVHKHLLEVSTGRLVCACDPCAWRFPSNIGARFKIIPTQPRALSEFQLSDERWESFSLPINLAFFVFRSSDRKMRALYPSPGGATEALLPMAAWEQLILENPGLASVEADVEALLVNRVQSRREYYLAPVDRCYELVGLIRLHWRGFTGGDEVWKQIDAFFDRLRRETSDTSSDRPSAAEAVGPATLLEPEAHA